MIQVVDMLDEARTILIEHAEELEVESWRRYARELEEWLAEEFEEEILAHEAVEVVQYAQLDDWYREITDSLSSLKDSIDWDDERSRLMYEQVYDGMNTIREAIDINVSPNRLKAARSSCTSVDQVLTLIERSIDIIK